MLRLDTALTAAPDTLLPFTKEQADALDAAGHLDPDCTHGRPSVSKEYLGEMLPRFLFPLNQKLSWLGLDDLDIRIRAAWMPEEAYADRPDRPLDAVEYTEDMSISGFFVMFFLLCTTASSSTTAHRRFKGAFTGQCIHIWLDADQNRAHLWMQPDLAEALNTGFAAWTKTK